MPRVSLNLPSVKSAAAGLAIAVVAVSLVMALFKLAAVLALWPGRVLGDLALWQVVTYCFVVNSPMGVIFTAIILYSIGGALETWWGTARLLRFALGTTVLAAVATVLLALVWPALTAEGFIGGTAMSGAVWVAYGLVNGTRRISFWGIPVSGNVFALIGAGFVFLTAAFSGLASVVPDAFALLFAFLATRGVSPSQLWTRLRSHQLERDLRRRAKNLRVVGGEDRNMPRDSDRFLH